MIRTAIVEDENAAADELESCLTRFGKECGEIFRVTRHKDPVELMDKYPGYDIISWTSKCQI